MDGWMGQLAMILGICTEEEVGAVTGSSKSTMIAREIKRGGSRADRGKGSLHVQQIRSYSIK